MATRARARRAAKRHVVIVLRGEEHLEEAARRHFEVGCLLAAEPRFLSEARFHVLVAVECFLKARFCRVRFERHGFPRKGKGFPFATLTFTEARSYSHDLHELIKDLMPTFPKRSRPILGRLQAELPRGQQWNEDRYGPRLLANSPEWQSALKILELVEALFAPNKSSNTVWRRLT